MKDPLIHLRHAIQRDQRRARAAITRLKRRVLIVVAVLGGVGVLLVQNDAGDCRSNAVSCDAPALNAASLGLGLMPHGAAPPEPNRQNPAMEAALAARAAAGDRQPVPGAAPPRATVRPVGALAPALLPPAPPPARISAGERALYFTDMLPER